MSERPFISQWLPIELTNGNDGRGNKWFKSARVRDKIEEMLRQGGFVPNEPVEGLCAVRITRILGKGQRLWDADSILRGNSKELLDALVAVGWFVDDSPKYIAEVVGCQDASQRGLGASIKIEVFRLTTPE